MKIKDTPPMTIELAAKALTLVNEFKLKQHQAPSSVPSSRTGSATWSSVTLKLCVLRL